MRWQRRARLVLAVFLAGLVSLLYLATRPRAVREAPSSPPRSDPEALTETAPGTITLESGDTIAFERLLTYPEGRSVARGVTVTVREGDGRTIVIRGREAWQQAPSTSRIGRLTVQGDVVARTSDGLEVRTDRAHYDDATGILDAPGTIAFEQQRIRGSGAEARYDRRLDHFTISRDARVRIARDGQDGLDAASSRATFARAEHTIRAEGGVQVVDAGRTMTAATAVFRVSPDDSRLVGVWLDGDARVRPATDSETAQSGLVEMAADQIDLQYADDGRTLRQARLAERARLAFAGAGGEAGRRVEAATIELVLAPDGVSVARVSASGRVRLEVPATGAQRAQVIRAAALEGRGEEGRGLRAATLTGGVQFEEPAVARSAARAARADRLQLSWDPSGETLAAAQFEREVRFAAGNWHAQAAAARYDPAGGRITLTAPPGGARPRVAGNRLTVDADRIELALDAEQVRADGGVRSVIAARGAGSASGAAEAARLPALLDQTQPVYLSAGWLAYDGAQGSATYGGGARLWQGAHVVRGDQVVLDERRGGLVVSGGAAVELRLDAPPGQGTRSARSLSGTAERIEYDDETRTLRYRGTAHVDGPAGELRAEQVDLILTADARDLARLEASGSVEVVLSRTHTASGGRLTWETPTERYRIEGRPARLREEKPGACRETTGAVLTFSRSADTIAVDGTEANRSRTRPVACAERRP